MKRAAQSSMRILLSVSMLLYAACSDNSPLGAADGGVPDATATCEPGTRWSKGTRAFKEVTDAWGLKGVQGIYLSVTDIDGDGWPDLLVRNGGGGDDFAKAGAQKRWVLRNSGKKSFVDVTKKSGLLRPRGSAAGGARSCDLFVSGDVDNDGDLDVFTGRARTDSTKAGQTSEVMLNNGDGTFSLGPKGSAARFADLPSNPKGATFVDFDGDGLLDLWVVHNELPGLVAMQDSLLRGDGKGGFTDVTAARGLTTKPWKKVAELNAALGHSWGWGANACDLNGDGLPELLASSYGRLPNHLWRATRGSNGVVRFVNDSVASGYAFDGNVDWTTNLSAQCYCKDHPSAAGCGTAPSPDASVCQALAKAFGPNYRWNHNTGRELFQLGGVTGTTICADINSDGHLDLLSMEIVHSDVGASADPTEVLLNEGAKGTPRFKRPGNEVTGLTRADATKYWDHGDMTGALFDFDNDGRHDVYIGASDYPNNRGLLYHQSAPVRFTRVPVADYFTHHRSHGVAVADFDRDGDLDMVVGHSLHRCNGSPDCASTSQVRMFENTLGQAGNWLQLALEGGVGSNRAAVGARVYLSAAGQTRVQQVDGGHGRMGLQQHQVLHFGLGVNCQARVRVAWPDRKGTSQTFTLGANHRYAIKQGGKPVVVVR